MDVQKFREAMGEVGLSEYTDKMLGLARNAVRITCESADESEIGVGQSKIGGMPDLPAGVAWPEWVPPVYPRQPGFFARLFGKTQPIEPEPAEPQPLGFVAQFNLAEVASFDLEKRLPDSGMLYFFYDAKEQPWGYDPAQRGGWRVIYYPGDTSSLVRAEAPAELDKKSVFKACRPVFSTKQMMPNWESALVEAAGITDRQVFSYNDAAAEAEGETDEFADECGTKLLGYPDQVQNPDMMAEAQFASNGLLPGPEATNDPRAQELRKGILQWRLLFQLDSEDAAGMHWVDAGSLFFWIREEDLARRDFENVWLVLQCC